MGQIWKPIEEVREYGNQTEFVETNPFGQVSEGKQNIPVNGRQITDDIFEINMLDGTVKKFYVGYSRTHHVMNGFGRMDKKVIFNLVEM